MNNNRTMKQLPESERPYEKCLRSGATSLSNAELLAVILRCGSQGETAGELALRLLCELEPRGGLRALAHISPEELKECRGIGTVKAIQLLCTAELARRISQEEAAGQVRMRDPDTVAAYFMGQLGHEPQETVIAAFFDTRSHLLHHETLSRGTVNASVITPREVFLEALKYRAVYVVLLHNHPSGDPTPSEEDLVLTQRMEEAGRILSVPLADHIIIGDHRYISLKEQGLLL